MNWLGAGFRALAAAVIGALLGAFIHVHAIRRGHDLSPLVGLLAGTTAALVSRHRSGLRGLFVASLAVWAAAIGEVIAAPRRGVLADLFAFHHRIDILHGLAYAACAALAGFIASRAWRVHTHRPGRG